MQKIDWVREYIHKLFSSDIGKQGVEIRNGKLDYINVPLYKYCYVCEEAARSQSTVDYNIDNFENDILFFQNPSKFNDPFDCFLGFSQSQIIRDLLTQELRRKKQLTPQNRKAIKLLFSEQDDSLSLQSNINGDIKLIIENIMSLSPDDDPLKSIFSEIIQSLNDQGNEMLIKLATNTMTIRDKQTLVDIIYSNPNFQEYIKNSCNSEHLDFILKVAPRDMKIKIENDPDSFMSDHNGDTFGIFDFLKFFLVH